MSFKQFLAENSNALTATKEFESIQKLDPNFAKKLLVAWDGDERDYAKNKQIVSLFLKLIQPDALKKMSKLRLDDLTHEIVKKLETLHKKAMPHDSYKPKFVDKSVWSHEKVVREYEELRQELESLNEDRDGKDFPKLDKNNFNFKLGRTYQGANGNNITGWGKLGEDNYAVSVGNKLTKVFPSYSAALGFAKLAK